MWIFSFWEEICKYFARMNQQDDLNESIHETAEEEVNDVGLDIDKIDGNVSVLDEESHSDQELKEEIKEEIIDVVQTEEPVEEPVEEVKEEPVEEVKEEPIEEVKEEPVEEVKEEPVEEVKEEPVEEVKEEPVEEVKEEPVEEVKEEPVKEEPIEEVNEEPAEEVKEEPVEEVKEEPVEEVKEEPVEEVKQEPVEEVKEEPVEEVKEDEVVEEPLKEEEVKEEEIVVLQDPTIFSKEGKKKALLIGINYNTDDNEGDDLNGCENDMNRLSDWIQEKCYFSKDDINRLDSEKATREAIENGIIDLLNFAKSNPNSELWLSYSGHGSYYFSMRESDYQNEILCPSDYATKGFISDDWLKSKFVDELPSDCKVFVIMDCCHSGSNMDLPYCLKDNAIVLREKMEVKENMAKVIKFSGCLDSQVSMDYYNRNMREFQGAFTNSFVMSNKNQLFRDTLEGLNLHLRVSGFKQISELALSNPELWLWKLYE